MNRSDVDWWGYWPAAPTPFDVDGRLDERAWRALLAMYLDQRVHGVLVNGSTGEWFSQSNAERERLTEIAVEVIAGRVPVVIGVSAYTAREAGALARHAARSGASGVLATPPPYVHPSTAEIIAFYSELSASTDLPFMVYNWPRGVSVDMCTEPGLMQRLADLEQVVAIKDSTGDWLGMLHTVESVSAQVRVFGSFLHRRGLAVLLGMGGDGNIDGGGLGAPFGVAFYEAVRRGDRTAAEEAVDRYVRLSSGLIRADYSGVFASPIPQLKAAMALLNQPGGQVRPPLLPLDDPGSLAAIQILLDEVELTAGR